nr:hypothetical protein [Pedobacter frigoris]
METIQLLLEALEDAFCVNVMERDPVAGIQQEVHLNFARMYVVRIQEEAILILGIAILVNILVS